jgi:outer membrane protein assembly factor BamB
LPSTWSATANVAWQSPLEGAGVSSPIVSGNRVFVTSQAGDGRRRAGNHPTLTQGGDPKSAGETTLMKRARTDVAFIVEAFDRASGKRVWIHETKPEGDLPPVHDKHNLASASPVTDGERVYAWFGNGQLVALDMNGRLVWSRHLGLEYSRFETQWGHGSSPTLHGDLLILLCDHLTDAYLLAVDVRTGKERWKVARGNGRVSHSTPLVVPGPQRHELLINSSRRIDAYDPLTGKQLWYTGSERQTPIPTAVYHDGRIYLSRGYRNSDYMAIRPGGNGDITKTHVEWQGASGASYVPSIIYYDGLLYMTNEVGVVTCADAKTGERVWRHRLDGVFFASPVAGNGKIYMVSETGKTFVLRAGRTPEVLAENDLDDRFLASPAISGGRIFLRSDRTIYAVGS